MNKINIKYYFDKNIILIKNNYFYDKRGNFSELYNNKFFKKIGINVNFVQDNLSFSKKKYTIRGLHYQSKPMSQCKLIRVNKGSIYDVVVDLRKNSKTYGAHKGFKLTENDGKFLFVSEKFAHGFCTLKNNTEVFYKVSNYYSKSHEKSILWSDKFLKINWHLNDNKPILSNKDEVAQTFQEAKI